MSKDPLEDKNGNSLKYGYNWIWDDAKKMGNKNKGMKLPPVSYSVLHMALTEVSFECCRTSWIT